MVLDPKKAETLDCKDCTPALQILRNCDGRGSPAKIELNGRLYRQCPRAIYLKNLPARHLVNTFMDCRRSRIYPFPGSREVQTTFTVELFDFIERLISEHQERERARVEADSKPRKV